MVFPVAMYGCESWTVKKAEHQRTDAFELEKAGEGSWESLGLQGDPTSPSWRRSVLSVHCKDWCWSWNSRTLATWCEELTHLKRPWCWERLRAGGDGDDRGWDGWMASPTQWTWVWVDSGTADGQGGLVRCGSWVTESDITEWLNWLYHSKFHIKSLTLDLCTTQGFQLICRQSISCCYTKSGSKEFQVRVDSDVFPVCFCLLENLIRNPRAI